MSILRAAIDEERVPAGGVPARTVRRTAAQGVAGWAWRCLLAAAAHAALLPASAREVRPSLLHTRISCLSTLEPEVNGSIPSTIDVELL
jgi:hypothetical protein